MSQLTIRAPDEVVERVRRMAQRSGRSMNEYVVAVLDAATNPALGGTEAERLRERLASAGLLDPDGSPPRVRPHLRAAARARQRAGRGTPLSEIVARHR